MREARNGIPNLLKTYFLPNFNYWEINQELLNNVEEGVSTYSASAALSLSQLFASYLMTPLFNLLVKKDLFYYLMNADLRFSNLYRLLTLKGQKSDFDFLVWEQARYEHLFTKHNEHLDSFSIISSFELLTLLFLLLHHSLAFLYRKLYYLIKVRKQSKLVKQFHLVLFHNYFKKLRLKH